MAFMKRHVAEKVRKWKAQRTKGYRPVREGSQTGSSSLPEQKGCGAARESYNPPVSVERKGDGKPFSLADETGPVVSGVD